MSKKIGTGKTGEEAIKQTGRNKKICYFVQDPDKDCYISNLTSYKIESAIKYCGGNFEECEIFQRKIKEKQWTK